MNMRSMEKGLWLATLVLAVAALRSWRSAALPPAPSSSLAIAPAVLIPRRTADSIEQAAERLVDRNPFRLSRRPSDVPFGGEPRPIHLAVPAPAPARPALQLLGIAGPPWRALVEGVPGREGAVVVRQGEALGQLHVRRIDRGKVVMDGYDTTWTLTVRRPWP